MSDGPTGAGFVPELVEEEGTGLGKTRSGIYVPVGPQVRAWIKLRGEPAQVMHETPAQVLERIMEMEDQPERRWFILHSYNFGNMNIFLRSALAEIAFIADTNPTWIATKTHPGTIYTRTCPCAKFGGPCPPVE